MCTVNASFELSGLLPPPVRFEPGAGEGREQRAIMVFDCDWALVLNWLMESIPRGEIATMSTDERVFIVHHAMTLTFLRDGRRIDFDGDESCRRVYEIYPPRLDNNAIGMCMTQADFQRITSSMNIVDAQIMERAVANARPKNNSTSGKDDKKNEKKVP